MKRYFLIGFVLLFALVLVACGEQDLSSSENTAQSAPVTTEAPGPAIDHNLPTHTVMDYVFTYGNFVKSTYNGIGNPISRVYYNPTTMEKTPLCFYYAYDDKGKLTALRMGEEEDATPWTIRYDGNKPYEAAVDADEGSFTLRFTLNAAKRITAEDFGFVKFVYDESGRICEESGTVLTESFQIITEHEKDKANVRATCMGQETFTLSIGYNENRYPTSMSGVLDGVMPWQYAEGLTTWEYDEIGRCEQFSMKTENEHQAALYRYDDRNRIVGKTISTYNDKGELVEQKQFDKDGNEITAE